MKRLFLKNRVDRVVGTATRIVLISSVLLLQELFVTYLWLRIYFVYIVDTNLLLIKKIILTLY